MKKRVRAPFNPAPVFKNGITIPETRGRKKGVKKYDNDALVRKAAIDVITKVYLDATEAAEQLISEFKTGSKQDSSKITMFRKLIIKEIAVQRNSAAQA